MPRRSLIAFAAVVTHICLGSVYAWSVFVPALTAQTGWTKPQVTWAFSFAIAALGLTAALASRRVAALGPRRAVALSALCFGLGLLGAGLALKVHSLLLLYVTYGLIGGIGLGLGYVPPVTTLLRWFPDRKGLATGLAVGGFGIGALLGSFLGEALLARTTVGGAFVGMGVLYAPVIFLASRCLHLPEVPEAASPEQGEASPLKDRRFVLIWCAFFLNIASGILLIALARPMLEEAGRGWLPAVTAVAVMGLFNGLGRLGWSSLSDRVGRLRVWGLMFALQGLAFLGLAQGAGATVLALGLWLIASCYGGGFALCPALVADTFGPVRGPRAYGLALTAWSAAALVSPPLGAFLREALGSYRAVLVAGAAACLLGIALVMALGRKPR